MIAYFSMEVAAAPEIPTYAGGLGVLAGDTLRSAADTGVPLVGVTLLHRQGYFRQQLDAAGRQSELPDPWDVGRFLVEQAPRVSVIVEGRPVQVRAWKYAVHGMENDVPLFFLDTDVPGNAPQDRALTDRLYGGDARHRLAQEVLLGIGGVRMLRALGYTDIARFHMNEGHSSLLVLELLLEEAQVAGRTLMIPEDVAAVRRRCVFTTHTPVAAGHDHFSLDDARAVLGNNPILAPAFQHLCCHDGRLNLTHLALNGSHYVNGVAMRHGEVARSMFGGYTIDAITNGVHAATWAADEFQTLYDRYVPGWRRDNLSLRYALSIPGEEIWRAHTAAKARLLSRVRDEAGVHFDPDVFTIGFGRRATEYKRADLLFFDTDRLEGIAARQGPMQVVFAGKSHPADASGRRMIERVFDAKRRLTSGVSLVYLAGYDMTLGRLLTSGVDVWLNTPQAPFEASGTSGMKAALNGVPSLSVLDGWWLEGWIENITGWAIGTDGAYGPGDRQVTDAASLYAKLDQTILPLFHRDRDRYVDVMRHAIALNGSFFNSHRMLEEYTLKAYAE